MIKPKKVKYLKSHKRISKQCETKFTFLKNGEFGIKLLQAGRLTASQLNSVKLALSKKMKRVGKIWLNGFPDLSVTKKPAETRMGKGKGNVEFWCLPVKTGRILFEISGISSTLAKEALLLAKSKLSLTAKIIFKYN